MNTSTVQADESAIASRSITNGWSSGKRNPRLLLAFSPFIALVAMVRQLFVAAAKHDRIVPTATLQCSASLQRALYPISATATR